MVDKLLRYIEEPPLNIQERAACIAGTALWGWVLIVATVQLMLGSMGI